MEKIKLGLKENWKQFTLLVIVNAFVGGMVGMERTILPQFAELKFGVASKSAILSFITAFGITKAMANFYTGKLANKFGRRNLLLFGWLLAMPVPFLLIYADSWNWVIFANILLGISQGLTWSSTVVMKIDLVAEKNRGLAMGLNEFAGYFAIGIIAFLSGYVANRYGITPYPFYIGIFISFIGFILTFFWIKDTRSFVSKESMINQTKKMNNIFIETTFKNKTLSSVTQAGLINNLNDGMIWGLLPILLLSLRFDTENIGLITAIYPTFWGIGQLFTGRMSDHYSKKSMLFWGMLIQGLAILFIPYSNNYYVLVTLSAILGLGTALVYPTFLSTIALATSPQQRAESIGTFRLWRDLGYAFGAVISGITADLFGVDYAILAIGGLTIISSLIIKARMPEQIKQAKECMKVEEVIHALHANKKIQIIDVRSKEEYQQFHIPNALNIVLTELKDSISHLDKDVQFVIACGKGGGRSAEGARLIRELGFNAVWLCGGTNKWQEINN
ncbi:MFS transporter [Cytophagales bacterium RKSG123]|nr:MFS transporter [Xanthovirga aplysinae]